MNLTKDPNPTATVTGAGVGALSPATVYVADPNGEAGLAEGKKVVLATAAGYSAELTTTATIGTPVAADTTYVTPDQFAKTGNWNNPTLRLYTWRETWRKVRSPAGILLLLTTAIGLIAALAGLYFAVWGESPTSAATAADRAQTALEWTVAPAEQLDSNSSPNEVSAAREEVARRRVQVSECLTLLAGRDAPTPDVLGVTCKPNSPPWWKDTDTATWVTLVVGVGTALLAALGLRSRFAFGATPADG